MTLVDVNVLIGAFRTDAATHSSCLRWLRETIDDAAPFGVSTLALAAVVRITTQPNFFPSPSAAVDAIGFCDDMLAQPHCKRLHPGQRHWGIFKDLVVTANARSKLVTDAWFAALAIEHGCKWVTLDRDFGKFKGLRWTLVK